MYIYIQYIYCRVEVLNWMVCLLSVDQNSLKWEVHHFDPDPILQPRSRRECKDEDFALPWFQISHDFAVENVEMMSTYVYILHMHMHVNLYTQSLHVY